MQLVINGVLSFAEVINATASKTLVILPGWGHNSQHWSAFVRRLPTDIRFVLLDLPGFGQTQHLPSGAGVPEYVDWLVEFLQKADIQKPLILGHSFGGQVAVAFAATLPDSLERLILISPSAIRNKSKKVRILEQIYRHLKWLKALTPKGLFARLRPFLASDDYHQASPEQKQVLSTILLQDQSHNLPRIRVPTEIIWGENDTEIPYAGKLLAEKIPNAKLYVLYGVDHSPQLSAPEKLTAVLNEILDTL